LQIQFSQQEQAFCAQVDGFIAQYWPAETAVHSSRSSGQAQVWYKAVVDMGWSVPGWPVEFGGTQWSAVEHYIWQSRCMAANAPATRTFATEHVGPLLFEYAPQVLLSEYLPGIRDFTQGWCFGWKEAQWPDLSQHMATTLAPVDTGKYLLNGEKRAVLGVLAARWMLVGFTQKADQGAAQILDQSTSPDDEEYGLCIVDLTAQGVDVRPSSASQSQFGAVVFTNVVLDQADILSISGQAFIQRIAQQSASSEPQGEVAVVVAGNMGTEIQVTAPALQRQLTDIQGYIAQQGYVDDEELSRDINELGVDLAVLHALELRVLAQNQNPDSEGAQSEGKTLSPLILQISADKIRAKLGALQIASFGYYALPDFDARLFDNEGPIYPQAHLFEQNASSLVGQGLVGLGGGREEFELKDILAGSELGLNDTSEENR
jgi:alkylation response protein AidB-like acyl-CoA dehydrogenase